MACWSWGWGLWQWDVKWGEPCAIAQPVLGQERGLRGREVSGSVPHPGCSSEKPRCQQYLGILIWGGGEAWAQLITYRVPQGTVTCSRPGATHALKSLAAAVTHEDKLSGVKTTHICYLNNNHAWITSEVVSGSQECTMSHGTHVTVSAALVPSRGSREKLSLPSSSFQGPPAPKENDAGSQQGFYPVGTCIPLT